MGIFAEFFAKTNFFSTGTVGGSQEGEVIYNTVVSKS